MLLFGVGIWPKNSMPLPPAPSVFSDNFNRADGALGDSWTKVGGTASAAIASEAVRWSTGTDAAFIAPDTGSPYHFAEARIKTASTFNGFHVACCLIDQANYIGVRNRSSGTQIYRCVAGTLTLVGTAPMQPVDTIFRIWRDSETGTVSVGIVTEGVVTTLVSSIAVPAALENATKAGFVVRSDSLIPAIDDWRSGAL